MSELATTAPKEADQVPLSFVASVSHELRGPLHAIMGLSELLAERDIRQEDKRLVKALQTEAATLKVLIDDLLDYARMSDAGLELGSEPFSPPQLVASLVESARPNAQNRGLNLEFRCDANVPSHVEGDSVRYGQVVRNLLGNAAKFTETGSIRVSLSMKGDKVCCTVADTGPGIDPEKIHQIFTPFKQLHGTGRGAGLGLAICAEIAKLMDGNIGVKSEVGVGSEFEFTASLNEIETPTASTPVPEQVVKSGQVLVVEDNEVNQLLASQQLKLLGYESVIVGDGESAVEIASDEFVAILMDWNLPGISGLEATRQIRAKGGALAEIPIVAMTANALGSDADQCYAAGMNGFLAKPVAVASLREELNRVIATGPVQEGEVCEIGGSSVLEQLEEDLGSRDTVAQLVNTFLGELKTHIATISSAINEAGFEQAKRSAHTLGSTAALLGANKLSEQCRTFSRLETWNESAREAADEITATAADSELTLREYLA